MKAALADFSDRFDTYRIAITSSMSQSTPLLLAFHLLSELLTTKLSLYPAVH